MTKTGHKKVKLGHSQLQKRNVLTHFMRLPQLPKRSAHGTAAPRAFTCLGSRHNKPFLIVSTLGMGTSKTGRPRVRRAGTARPNIPKTSELLTLPAKTACMYDRPRCRGPVHLEHQSASGDHRKLVTKMDEMSWLQATSAFCAALVLIFADVSLQHRPI